MNKRQNVEAFLAELTTLSQKYGVYIQSHWMDQPWLVMSEDGKQASDPVAERLGYRVPGAPPGRYTVEWVNEESK